MADSNLGSVEGLEVRVISLEKLMSSKRAAGRPKDIDDLRTLEALKAALLKQKAKPD